MEERWLPIPGWTKYEVSDLGRVRSYRYRGSYPGCAPRVLKTTRLSAGYPGVMLHPGRKTKTVHTLVLEAFVGPCPEGMVCRHFPDRDPQNVRLDNLSWGTYEQNSADMLVHGTRLFGDKSPMGKDPTKAARGDRHGSKTHPERTPRGDSHPWTRHQAPRGTRNGGWRTLYEPDVIEILQSSKGHTALAREYGVHRSTIYLIRKRVLWKHVTLPPDWVPVPWTRSPRVYKAGP